MDEYKKNQVAKMFWDELSTMLWEQKLSPWENSFNQKRMDLIFAACMDKVEANESQMKILVNAVDVHRVFRDFIVGVLLEMIMK